MLFNFENRSTPRLLIETQLNMGQMHAFLRLYQQLIEPLLR